MRPPIRICALRLEQGTFREDLYYRLNVVPDRHSAACANAARTSPGLPSISSRKLAGDSGSQADGLTEAAIEKLAAYGWPGNVRELENVIERSLVMARGTMLDAPDIRLDTGRQTRPTSGDFSLPPGMTLDQYEQEILRQALKTADGNKSHAARLLGLTRNALRYRLTQMGIES